MIPLPIWIKQLVPGYRAKWRRRYAGMLAQCRESVPGLRFGQTDDIPWIEIANGGPRLHGFWTEPKNAEVFDLLRADLPRNLPKSHFRLMKDYINRYLYPHMRPDWKPDAASNDQLFGFHGQHKDAIADLTDPADRDRLTAAFIPKPDDVIIDCGAFLGFGELRLAPDVPTGHIYAVEADADSHALLERNLSFNGIDNVTALHRASWNAETELELETGFAQANSLVGEVCEGLTKQPVKTVTVDGLVAAHQLNKLDMLSLTLNGGEIETLDGAQHTLANLRPRVRLAGWYERGGTPIWRLTKAQLEPHGYDVFVGYHGNLMALPR